MNARDGHPTWCDENLCTADQPMGTHRALLGTVPSDLTGTPTFDLYRWYPGSERLGDGQPVLELVMKLESGGSLTFSAAVEVTRTGLLGLAELVDESVGRTGEVA